MVSKKCPACKGEHQNKTTAKKCLTKKLGKQSWTWDEFDLKDPSAEVKVSKPKEEKKEFDFEKAFDNLKEILTKTKEVK